MESTEKKLVNESEKAASSLSQVNPNSTVKALKDKGTLVLVIFVVLMIFLFMNTSKATTKEKGKAASYSSTESENVLSNNLLLIKKMKQGAKDQGKTQEVTRSFHDGTPVLGAFPGKPKNQPRQQQANNMIRPVKQSPRITKEMLARMNAPTTFVNTGISVSTQAQNKHSGFSLKEGFAGADSNSQFINQQGAITSVTATRIAHPDLTVPAGELIPATMNVAMNSELPGMISAVTERDVYSLTGSNVLVPRGSKLLGQYNSGVVQGQSRFLVVWNRVQLPNGVVVTLNSPGSDGLGRSGLQADSVDRHFMERFGAATLLSVLGAATANVGVNSQTQFNSASQYRSAIAESLNQTAAQTLDQDMRIKPTLHKFQGVEANVFVAHDLDFSAVGTQEVRHARITKEVWK